VRLIFINVINYRKVIVPVPHGLLFMSELIPDASLT
jgi:hypothetical protein